MTHIVNPIRKLMLKSRLNKLLKSELILGKQGRFSILGSRRKKQKKSEVVEHLRLLAVIVRVLPDVVA